MNEIVSLNAPRKRVAVIGSGISGLGAAWALRHTHDVVLYEKRDRLGGHSATVDIDYDGTPLSVDTGFIVFNPLNYPNLVALFEHLGIETQAADMSFGFAVKAGLEWCSNGLGGVFAQKRNLARPSFLLMLRGLLAPGLVVRCRSCAAAHAGWPVPTESRRTDGARTPHACARGPHALDRAVPRA